MRAVFADTVYWIALVKPRDSWKESALEARRRVGEAQLITTDGVLTEFLNALSAGGPAIRHAAVRMVESILANPNVRVLPQTHDEFLDGMERYRERLDKEYSHTDCVSMNVMESEGINEILSNDHHFDQEGMILLMKRDES